MTNIELQLRTPLRMMISFSKKMKTQNIQKLSTTDPATFQKKELSRKFNLKPSSKHNRCIWLIT